MASETRTRPGPLLPAGVWPSDDTEESVVGTDLHQTTIVNLRWGINEVAALSRAPGQPAPWQVPPSAPLMARSVADLQARVRACRLCQEHGYIPCAHPITEGRADDRILLIGQAPGHVSVEKDRPFGGPAGRLLDAWLARAGFPPGSLHQRVYLSSLTKCDPGRNLRGGGDRAPSPAEIALCRPHLEAELALLRPAVILLLGGLAITHFLGKRRLDEVVGRSFTSAEVVWRPLWPGHEQARLLPLPHSSGVSRWLNDSAHQRLLDAALCELSRRREECGL